LGLNCGESNHENQNNNMRIANSRRKQFSCSLPFELCRCKTLCWYFKSIWTFNLWDVVTQKMLVVSLNYTLLMGRLENPRCMLKQSFTMLKQSFTTFPPQTFQLNVDCKSRPTWAEWYHEDWYQSGAHLFCILCHHMCSTETWQEPFLSNTNGLWVKLSGDILSMVFSNTWNQYSGLGGYPAWDSNPGPCDCHSKPIILSQSSLYEPWYN
jgi:hypothetical protein